MPLISVVIPSYNRSTTIPRAIRSVLNQTYRDFEILIVDDCSTDNTKDIMSEMFSAENKIRYLTHSMNRGAQAARNTGIKASKGDWIAFLDSDDVWVHQKLQWQVDCLRKHNFEKDLVIHGNALAIEELSGRKYEMKPAISGNTSYRCLLERCGPMFQAILCSKTSLEKISFLDENVPSFQEWDTSIRLAQHCEFIHLDKTLFVYNKHLGETISKNLLKDIEGYQYIIDKHEEQIRTCCGNHIFDAHLRRQLRACLEFGLWDLSEKYFDALDNRILRREKLKYLLCKTLKIRPSNVEWVKIKLTSFRRKLLLA